MGMGMAWDGPVCLLTGWRAALIGAAAAAALSGCSHLPDWLTGQKQPEQTATVPAAVPAPPQPAPHKPKVKSVARHPEAPVEVASLDPATLVGLRPPAVTRILGAPERTSKDEMSLVWTYGAQDCVLQVYFYPDLNTTDFHVLKYSLAGGDGKPLDAADPCLRKILSAKNDDPR